MKIHELHSSEGSKKRRKRVGRGIGAGQGKTAGRGTKGQNARSGGGVRPYFEGGQLPLMRRLPFVRGHGFFNPYHMEFRPVNLLEVALCFEADAVVSPETLAEVGLIKHAGDLVVLLAVGEIDHALTVRVHRISDAARRKIEAAGGKVELLPWQRGGRHTR